MKVCWTLIQFFPGLGLLPPHMSETICIVTYDVQDSAAFDLEHIYEAHLYKSLHIHLIGTYTMYRYLDCKRLCLCTHQHSLTRVIESYIYSLIWHLLKRDSGIC